MAMKPVEPTAGGWCFPGLNPGGLASVMRVAGASSATSLTCGSLDCSASLAVLALARSSLAGSSVPVNRLGLGNDWNKFAADLAIL